MASLGVSQDMGVSCTSDVYSCMVPGTAVRRLHHPPLYGRRTL